MLEPSVAQDRDLGAIALTYSLTLCLAFGLVSGVFRSRRGTQHHGAGGVVFGSSQGPLHPEQGRR